MVYVSGGNDGTLNAPFAFVVAERTTPVLFCVTVTFALGTTASAGSVTVPVIAAFPPPWPSA
jgi:hypothetical protein